VTPATASKSSRNVDAKFCSAMQRPLGRAPSGGCETRKLREIVFAALARSPVCFMLRAALPMSRPASFLLPLLAVAWLAGCHAARAWESELFGPGWTATPPLSFYTDKIIQDFSFAGYRRGETSLPPDPPGATRNVVTDHGADPTGATDSTNAIQAAINAAQTAGGGVVFLPAGIYRVSPQGANAFCLRITSSGVVLRGAGTGQTFLLNTETVMRSKHIIQINGPSGAAWTSAQTPTTLIAADLPGPVTQIPVASTAGFSPGDQVIIRADSGDDWANEHLEPEWVGVAEGAFGRLMYLRRVIAVDYVNQRLTIDIPTRYTLLRRDNARVYRKTTLISEVGLEHFSIGNVQHPGTSGWGENDYLTEGLSAYDVAGCFAIRMQRARDSWIRGVSSFRAAGNTTTCHILNNGMLLQECQNVTVRDCFFQRPQYGGGGGAGYMFRLQNSGDCLLQDCRAEFNRHGFVFSHMSTSGCVLHQCADVTTGKQTGNTGNQNTSGRGSDHHMHFSHSNLIDTCLAENSWFEARYRPFGSAPRHNLTSAHGVFWNTEGRGTMSYAVHTQQSRYGYAIGTRGAVPTVRTDGSSVAKTNPVDHVEGVGQGASLTPFSLFREQRRRRLGLPAIEAVDQIEVLFPDYNATLAATVRYGDSTSAPTGALAAWEQTGGPVTALIRNPNPAALEVTFPRPGSYVFQLRAALWDGAEDDFAAARTVTVLARPPGWRRIGLPPVADAFVQNGEPNTNFNTNSLWAKGVGSSTVNREIFMRFDLSSLAGEVVREAVLEMHSTQPDTAATAQTHWVPDDSWGETTLTWSNKPAVSDLLSTWPLATDYRQLIDLTTRTAAEAAGDGLLSIRHSIVSQVNNDPVFRWASRESGNASLRPRLRLLLSRPDPGFTAWMAGFPEIPVHLRGAADDADGDGRSNFEEYVLGSAPHQPDGSALTAVRAGGQWGLRVRGGAGLRSSVFPQLEFSTGLEAGGWSVLEAPPMSLDGDDLILLAPAAAPHANTRGFFRVRWLLLP
jgi:hypothetical protein